MWAYYILEYNILIKTTENVVDRGRYFELSYVFATSEICEHLYVSYSQSL